MKSENDLIGLFLLVATLKFLNIVKDMATFWNLKRQWYIAFSTSKCNYEDLFYLCLIGIYLCTSDGLHGYIGISCNPWLPTTKGLYWEYLSLHNYLSGWGVYGLAIGCMSWLWGFCCCFFNTKMIINPGMRDHFFRLLVMIARILKVMILLLSGLKSYFKCWYGR